jgi:hypothetical protein
MSTHVEDVHFALPKDAISLLELDMNDALIRFDVTIEGFVNRVAKFDLLNKNGITALHLERPEAIGAGMRNSSRGRARL